MQPMASVIIVIHVYDYAVSTRDKVGIGGLGGFTMFHHVSPAFVWWIETTCREVR